MTERCRVIEDLIEGKQAEVDRHYLYYGMHPAERRAYARAHESRL
jgi:hypothetical protein